MEAPECDSGSYAWRSLLKGREVLGEGHVGEWEMGKQLRYGNILGCLAWCSRESYLQPLKVFKKLRLITLSILQIEARIQSCWRASLLL